MMLRFVFPDSDVSIKQKNELPNHWVMGLLTVKCVCVYMCVAWRKQGYIPTYYLMVSVLCQQLAVAHMWCNYQGFCWPSMM